MDEATVLFFGTEEMVDSENISIRVCEAQKHPLNPLIPLGRVDEWDAMRAAPWSVRTVLFDEKDSLFKCWYTGSDLSMEKWRRVGYAFSEDGIRWVKPNLGIHEFRGSTDNNIAMDFLGALLIDDDEPDPDRRFKMVVKWMLEEHSSRGIGTAYSPDGICWTFGPPVDLPGMARNPDIVTLVKDPEGTDPQRFFRLVWQVRHPNNKWGPETTRAKSIAFGADIEHFTPSADNPVFTPNEGPEQENHFLMLVPYAGYWIMLYECGWYAPNALGNYGQYLADIRLAVSRDGEHFTRFQPFQKVIPRGRRGEWDDGMLVISDKAIIRDGKIYLYYCGQGEDWSGWPKDNTPDGYRYESTGSIRTSRMGLATLRLDGFTCVETNDREIPGFFTTTPIDLDGSQKNLLVNLSDVQVDRSWVEIEVLDADTRESLSGFLRSDCQDLDRDRLREPVIWKGGALKDVKAKRVQFRFHLIGAARLYAFRIV